MRFYDALFMFTGVSVAFVLMGITGDVPCTRLLQIPLIPRWLCLAVGLLALGFALILVLARQGFFL